MAQYHGDITHNSGIKFQGGQSDKSLGLAYILWFFFGMLGAHRFYMGHIASGGFQLSLLILALCTISVLPLLGLITLIIQLAWVVVDVVLLWFMK